MKQTTVAIIGAGPAGLYFASLCEKNNIDYIVLEASDKIGGQITNLYPKKEIVDIPGIEMIISGDYISYLEKQVNSQNILLNKKVINIEGNIVFCDELTVQAKNIVIATGLGFSSPRPLGVEHENECSNIVYHVKDLEFLRNKKVAIFGGGDSALDWAKAVSKLSNDVHLIHRRIEFRGNADTIKDCVNLKIHLPFIPSSIKVENNKASSVQIKEVVGEGQNGKTVDIPVDYVLVNYGNIASSLNFGFETEGAFIKVDHENRVKNNIFVIGDACQYENKKRRIAPLIEESEKIIKLIQR